MKSLNICKPKHTWQYGLVKTRQMLTALRGEPENAYAFPKKAASLSLSQLNVRSA